VIFPKLKEQGEPASTLLTGEIDKKLPAELPSSDVNRENLAKRQANAAVALLRLGQPEKVWPLLKRAPPDDPRVRSYVIHRLAPLAACPGAILKRLDEEPDVTIRRALLLSLGEFSDKELSADDRKALLPKLQEMHRTAADPGLHAACEWLLRQWNATAWLKQTNDDWAKEKAQRKKRLEEIEQLLRKDKEKPAPRWYVNGQGQTMVVIPGPVEFLMGSPASEEGRSAYESQHTRRIGRTFAVAAKAVTVREFRRFLKENKLEEWFSAYGQAAPIMKQRSPEEDGPIVLVDWFHAAAYCNWLSKVEGIPPEQWCYETNARQIADANVSVYAALCLANHPLNATAASSYFLLNREVRVTALRKNYLSLQGYRLPTEAEMEYATRAGSVTSRYYGETEELLPRYAWYQKNSRDRTWPVGSLKPNDLGFFDVHGNAYTWCQEKGTVYPKKGGGQIEDKEDVYSINIQNGRALRGGSFALRASNVRSALRYIVAPADRIINFGFRPASTLPCQNSQGDTCGACQGAKSRSSSRVGPSQGGSAK
jgi:formylglycine-generating enzyme required for sulfatase activity